MNFLYKNFFKITFGLGSLLIISSTSNQKANANTCADNPNSLNNSCYITPATYKITVYEMGLCTSDPLAGTSIDENGDVTTDYVIDESSCSPTYTNENGSLVNLAGGSSQTLTGGTNLRPPTGSYPHAYIKIKNVFGLKGTYTVNDVQYYSKANGAQDTSASNYAEWNETLVDFDKGSECEPVEGNRLMAASETFNTGVTGTMKAMLASVSGGTYSGTTQANCGDSTRLFGVFAPTEAVVISDDTKGLEVSFTITNRGMSVIPQNAPAILKFGSGPFSPSFATF